MMDDNYTLPRRSNIMGKGRIDCLAKDWATIQSGDRRILVTSLETMKNPNIDLRDLLKVRR